MKKFNFVLAGAAMLAVICATIALFNLAHQPPPEKEIVPAQPAPSHIHASGQAPDYLPFIVLSNKTYISMGSGVFVIPVDRNEWNALAMIYAGAVRTNSLHFMLPVNPKKKN